jgi:uncharacterized membrane protein
VIFKGRAKEALPQLSHARGRRQLERLTTFSDGVVAVAITLLVLPLIDSLSEPRSEGVRKTVDDNGPLLIAFFFTFAVVAMMWSLHNRVFGLLRAYNVRIFWLNLLFLSFVALLPWVSALDILPSNLGGDNTGWSPTASLTYWSVLGTVQLSIFLLAWQVRRHPQLLADPEENITFGQLTRGWLFAVSFYAIGAFGYFFKEVGPWLPLVIFPLSALIGHYAAREDQLKDEAEIKAAKRKPTRKKAKSTRVAKSSR